MGALRKYAKVAPTLWIGETGLRLREAGPAALLVALYLLTSPNSNMLGLYYQPVGAIAAETGLTLEGVMQGLRGAIEAGFCHYDARTSMVWVVEMAHFQMDMAFAPTDNRVKGVQKDYDALVDNPFLAPWFDHYAADFHLSKRRAGRHPCQPLGKPLASQEQEQEQEQEQQQEQRAATATSTPLHPAVAGRARNTVATAKKRPSTPVTTATWDAYALAYALRYNVAPVRNLSVNAKLAAFVSRLGADEAPHVAAYYVGVSNSFYVARLHDVGTLLANCEALRTQWATGNAMTDTRARQIDASQSTLDAFAPLLAEARKRRLAEEGAPPERH